jgi:RNA polymerase sigma-70 factor, ECF subfamily
VLAAHRTAGVFVPEMAPRPAAETADRPALAFDDVYRAWFERVVRWLPAMGVQRADLEDVAQETFVIVQRRLNGFDGANLGAWLYAIALRVATNHRRLAWFRRVLLAPDHRAEDPAPTPELGAERAQLLTRAEQLLAQLPTKQRRAFVLFEIEGYSGEEIAELEGVPVATVWTRVHHARKAFAARAAALREREARR